MLLDEQQAQVFHNYVAQLLFTSMRFKKDINMILSFITTWARAPGEYDWKKLRRLLKYVKCTMQLPLVKSVKN